MNRFEHKFYAVIIYLIVYFTVTSIFDQLVLVFWPGLFMVILGSHFPDFDLDFGTRFHRSPYTHSPLIPGIIFVGYLFSAAPAWVLEVMAWFIVGYATHLYFDTINSGSGLIGFIISAFKPHSSPGDIRSIDEPLEKPFLIVGGTLCLLMALTMRRLVRVISALPVLPISLGL